MQAVQRPVIKKRVAMEIDCCFGTHPLCRPEQKFIRYLNRFSVLTFMF